MITIDFASGKITAKLDGVLANATAARNKGGVHLTKGYISPDVFPPTTPGGGIRLDGDVDVLADTPAEASQILKGPNFFFGFIQIARLKNMSASWQGRRTGEGSVDLTTAGFPVSGDLVALDSDAANQPFFSRVFQSGFSRRAQPGQRIPVHVSNLMTDHPNYREVLVTQNSVTKSRNFLHALDFEVDFTSVFVAVDDKGVMQPIAHIIWKIDLHGDFKWKRGVASANKTSSSLKVGNSIAGAPGDPAVKAVLDTLGPPLAKTDVIERWREANRNPRMRVESRERSLLLKNDFFV